MLTLLSRHLLRGIDRLGDGVRQVWVNLISNAIKLTQQNATAHIKVGGSTESAELRYWVKDGAEALDFCFGPTAPSVQLLKLVMLDLPRVDGLDVLRALRADARTRTLPVVVPTSSQEEIDRVRAYDLGANSFMVKRVESEAFVQAVSQLGLYWILRNKLPSDTK